MFLIRRTMQERITGVCHKWGLNFKVINEAPTFIFPISDRYADGLQLMYYLDKDLYDSLTQGNQYGGLQDVLINPNSYEWVYMVIDSFYYLELACDVPNISKEPITNGIVDCLGPICNALALEVIKRYKEINQKRGGRLLNCLPEVYSLRENT